MSERYYRITIRGRLSDRFAAAFGGLRLEPGPDHTVLSGPCVDSSALFGVLDRIRDLGLELIAMDSAPLGAQSPRPGAPARP